jgi:peptide/nickel transport system permease protein
MVSDTTAFSLRAKTARHRAFFRVSLIPALPLFILGVIVVSAIFAPLLAPHSPTKIQLISLLSPPSSSHPLGTDHLGRDALSRLIYGSRISLIVGIVSVAWAAALGTLLGLISGFFGGKVDVAIMMIVLSMNLLGDWLRDYLDPKMRQV